MFCYLMPNSSYTQLLLLLSIRYSAAIHHLINYQTVSADTGLLLFVSPDWSVPMVAALIPRVLKATCRILNSVHYALTIKTVSQNKSVITRSHGTQLWCFAVAFEKQQYSAYRS